MSKYWEQRVANFTWGVYNSIEEKNRLLLEMYQEASLDIREELFKLEQQISKRGKILRSDIYKYNRLEKLNKKMEDVIKSLTEKVENNTKKNLYAGFRDIYKNIRCEFGTIDFTEPPEKLMEELLKKPWMGSSFSKRLWQDTQVLANNLNEIMTIGLTQGKTVTEVAMQLSNRMNKGLNITHRLVRTETMHYLNESAAKAYEDEGVKQVQFYAATDERTCGTCGSMHGEIYDITDRPILPIHCNCRCTIIPIVEIIKKKNKT